MYGECRSEGSGNFVSLRQKFTEVLSYEVLVIGDYSIGFVQYS